MNFKVLFFGELYGEYDFSINEWIDGVLFSVMRIVCVGIKGLGGGESRGLSFLREWVVWGKKV